MEQINTIKIVRKTYNTETTCVSKIFKITPFVRLVIVCKQLTVSLPNKFRECTSSTFA